MSDTHVSFDLDGAMGHVRGKAVGFLRRAAITVQRRAKELLSVAGTVPKSAAGKGRRARYKARKTGAVRSAPGEPPRKQTGRLRASVTYEVDETGMNARVGTNVKYGRYLELGTKRGIAPRPWLRRALAEMWARVNELLAAGSSGGGR